MAIPKSKIPFFKRQFSYQNFTRKDMFLYGCQVKNLPLEIREFAWVLSKVTPYFNYRRSAFCLESYKMGTARINLYQELKIKYSYTMETSFFGSEVNQIFFTENLFFSRRKQDYILQRKIYANLEANSARPY